MSTNYSFQLPYIPQTVVIFGCGGTGSRLIPAIAQLMSTLTTLIMPEMVLVDFDEVEEKNLSRQNFAKPDIGKNKAEALASRYSKAYGLKITPITIAAGTEQYLEALEMYGLRERLTGPAMYILAVDSASARRQILSSALSTQAGQPNSSVVIDAGNEDIFGQVSFFTTGKINANSAKDLEFIYNWYQGYLPGDTVVSEFPMDIGYYANMQDGESTRSCADLDQTLAINNLMAAQVIAYAQNFLMGKPVRSWRTSFDLFNGTSYDPIAVPEVLRRAAPFKTQGQSREVIQFSERVRSRLTANSNTMDAALTELSSSLEDEMLSETPVRYETAKLISGSLGNKFVPSLLFKEEFPDHYTEQFIAMWNEGFVIPEASEEDRRTYEIAERILAEMQAETEALNNRAAETAETEVAVPSDAQDED